MTFEEFLELQDIIEEGSIRISDVKAAWDTAAFLTRQEWDRQNAEITDMCVVCWVSTQGTLKEKVQRLIKFEVAIALDPAVSSSAQALITLSRMEAAQECELSMKERVE